MDLGNYIAATPHEAPTQAEAKQIQDLSRAGKRLMGFCRINLFKRLESSGLAFQQSIERHILTEFRFSSRNCTRRAVTDWNAGRRPIGRACLR